MVEGAVCPVTAMVGATGIGATAWAVFKSKQKPDVARFASVSALIFAAQMVNFPIQDGTSGHLLGGVLASALLGTPFGVLAMGLVLAVQALVFSDGGLSVLGANVVNMALLGAGVGGWMVNHLRGSSPLSLARLGFVAWLSVLLAALGCCVELALSGTIAFSASAPAMLGTHAVIGIGEALITVLAFSLLPASESASRKSAVVPALAAVLVASIISPWASVFPDGLESVAARLGFLHQSAPAFVAPLANYSMPGSLSAGLSTSLAGLIGVLVVFALGAVISLMWNAPRLSRAS